MSRSRYYVRRNHPMENDYTKAHHYRREYWTDYDFDAGVREWDWRDVSPYTESTWVHHRGRRRSQRMRLQAKVAKQMLGQYRYKLTRRQWTRTLKRIMFDS